MVRAASPGFGSARRSPRRWYRLAGYRSGPRRRSWCVPPVPRTHGATVLAVVRRAPRRGLCGGLPVCRRRQCRWSWRRGVSARGALARAASRTLMVGELPARLGSAGALGRAAGAPPRRGAPHAARLCSELVAAPAVRAGSTTRRLGAGVRPARGSAGTLGDGAWTPLTGFGRQFRLTRRRWSRSSGGASAIPGARRASGRRDVGLDIRTGGRNGRGVAGYLIGREVAGTGEVLNLAVAPESRRRGIAGALLEAGLVAFRRRRGRSVSGSAGVESVGPGPLPQSWIPSGGPAGRVLSKPERGRPGPPPGPGATGVILLAMA